MVVAFLIELVVEIAERGDGDTPPNLKSAVRFYELAVAQRHVRACFRLGVCLASGGGGGGGKNAVRAAQLLEKAAQAHLPEAQFHLAACYGT